MYPTYFDCALNSKKTPDFLKLCLATLTGQFSNHFIGDLKRMSIIIKVMYLL